MDALTATIMLWLSFNLGLPVTAEPARISIVPATEIALRRYRAFFGGSAVTAPPPPAGARAADRPREAVAVYDDVTRTIYLPQGWTGMTPADVSVLVHELVHHIQNANGLRYECHGAREAVAYRAQNAWLRMFGQDLESAFDLDRFTLKVSTACGF